MARVFFLDFAISVDIFKAQMNNGVFWFLAKSMENIHTYTHMLIQTHKHQPKSLHYLTTDELTSDIRCGGGVWVSISAAWKTERDGA